MEKITRRIIDDVDIQTIRNMHDQGMTNKEIANRIGCSPATISRYLNGKHTKKQENIPIFIQPKKQEESDHKESKVPEEKLIAPRGKKKAALAVVSEHRIVDLAGMICMYHVDTAAQMIELKTGGLVTGILDLESLGTFIQELEIIRQMFENPHSMLQELKKAQNYE